MSKLNKENIQHLKKAAHLLSPVVQIGKNGLTDGVLDSIRSALFAHELIKVKSMDTESDKKEMVEKIVEAVSCEWIQTVGHVFTFYKMQPDPQKRKIKLLNFSNSSINQ